MVSDSHQTFFSFLKYSCFVFDLSCSSDSCFVCAYDRACAHKGSVTTLETSRVAAEIEEQASAFVELAAQYLAFRSGESTHAAMGCSPALLLYGACEMCDTSALKCHRFSSTPHRPELCVCVHGASHHACVDPRMTRNMPTTRHSNLPDFIQPSGRGAAVARVSGTRLASTRWDLAAAELLGHCSLFLSSMGKAGIRDLLGLKRTAGSMDSRLPPSRRTLLEALNMPHAPAPALMVKAQPTVFPSSGLCLVAGEESRIPVQPDRRTKSQRATVVCNLTVGGRALCKHAVRATDSWWGGCGGTELDKSDRAEKAVLQVLAGATWVNLHVFGGGGEDGVFEVREESGYGARWSADGAVFRGFLEPHMNGGHDTGWRH